MDLAIKDQDGFTGADLAEYNGHSQCAKYLRTVENMVSVAVPARPLCEICFCGTEVCLLLTNCNGSQEDFVPRPISMSQEDQGALAAGVDWFVIQLHNVSDAAGLSAYQSLTDVC